MKQLIRLFMWGYQQHFARALFHLAEDVFKKLGVSLMPDVLLVGVAQARCQRTSRLRGAGRRQVGVVAL